MDLREINKLLALMPLSRKIFLLILVISTFFLLGYFYLYKPKQAKIEILDYELKKQQQTLQENLEITKGIKDIEEELVRIRHKLIEAQAQLPTEKEIPSLLTKISDLGNMVGLEFILFQPKPEVPQEFYNEVPIDIIIKSNYHTVAQFYDAIAHLPRIVNISNIVMKNPKLILDSIVLETSCQATTFRFTAKTAETENDKKTGGDQKK